MSENWLHINPTSGCNSSQLSISADTNTTGVPRKARIVITAGTMTRTIDIVQEPSEEYIVCTYVIDSTAVTLLGNNWLLEKAVITTTGGTVMEIDGNSLSSLITVQDWTSILGVDVGEEIKVTYFPEAGYMYADWFSPINQHIPVKTIAIYEKVLGVEGNALVFARLPLLESLYITPNLVFTGNDWNVALVADCPKLSAITGDHPFIQDSRTLSRNGVLLGYAPNAGEVYEVPSNITGIGGYCFARVWNSAETSSVKSIIIPSSVTTFHTYLTAKWSGFYGNSNLTSITIADSVVSARTEFMFYGCTALTDVKVSNAWTNWGREMFNGCSSLTGLTVPASVTGVGNVAYEHSYNPQVFSGCTSLTSITAESSTAPTVTYKTFEGIATGGTLYHPEESDYNSWLSDNEYYLGYYLWNDGIDFQLENVSTYYLQFPYNASSVTSAQSIFITANKPDYQLIASDVQNTTGTGVSWITVSGTPASGYTEFKVYPTSSAETQRNCWIQVVYSGNILATVTVQQLGYTSADTGSSEAELTIASIETEGGSAYLGPGNRVDFLGTINSSTSVWLINIDSNVVFDIVNDNTWFTVSGTPSVGRTTLRVYPNSNNNTSDNRWGEFYMKYNGQTLRTITVKQIPAYEMTSGVSYADMMTTGQSEIASSVTGTVGQLALWIPMSYNNWVFNKNNSTWPELDLQRTSYAPEGQYFRYAIMSLTPNTSSSSRSCTFTLLVNGSGIDSWMITQLGAN